MDDTDASTTARHTCLKLQLPATATAAAEAIFVKGTWYDSHFHLSITDGLHAWLCNGTEEEVSERASQWDQPVTEYVRLGEKHLGFQQPGSVYRFTDAGDGHKRLSWTFEKEGTKLEWRWKCQPSPDSKKTTAAILGFLMDANTTLSEQVIKKTRSFELMKGEAEKCLAQSERFCSEKVEFESAMYSKFLVVLNSKKQKLRDLRDLLSSKGTTGKMAEEEEGSTDKTESFDEGSNDEKSEEEPPEKRTDTSSSGRGRKRITCK